MLTGSQRVTLQKLKNGEIKDPKELKRARFGLRSYVSRMLRDIPELIDVMDTLGEDQISQLIRKGEIKTDSITAAANLTSELIRHMAPPGIQRKRFSETEFEAVKKFSPKIEEPLLYRSGSSSVPERITSVIVTFYRSPTPEEIDLHNHLVDLEAYIRALFDPHAKNIDLSFVDLIADRKTRYPGFSYRVDSMTALPPTEEEALLLEAEADKRAAEYKNRPDPEMHPSMKDAEGNFAPPTGCPGIGPLDTRTRFKIPKMEEADPEGSEE